ALYDARAGYFRRMPAPATGFLQRFADPTNCAAQSSRLTLTAAGSMCIGVHPRDQRRVADYRVEKSRTMPTRVSARMKPPTRPERISSSAARQSSYIEAIGSSQSLLSLKPPIA